MNLKTSDSSGYVPDLSLIGNRYRHWKNKKVYTVIGFHFDSERDRWTITHKCFDDVSYENPNPVLFNRTPQNFFEEVDRVCEPGVIYEIEPVARFTRV